MDLKSFADDDFSPKDWINKAWNASSTTDDKEVFVLNTVTKLQLYIKQLTNGLDETTAQIVRGIPTILQEASVLTCDGAALRDKLASLELRAGAVEADTGHSIDSLRRIDKLKSELQAACAALREADKWAQLATGLEEMLESRVPTRGEPLAQLTEQVSAMTASLEVLSGASDYESKRVQLEVLYNRLEAALSPAIVEALTQKDAEGAASFGAVLTAMGRRDAFVRYWRRVEAAGLEAEWRRRGDAGGAPRELLAELPAVLLSHAHSQMDWLVNVVRTPTPVTELICLYSELLPGLEPAPARLARAALSRCAAAADALNLLPDMRTSATHIVRSVATLSDSSKETLPDGAITELGRSLHAPLAELLPHYTELQARALTDQLASIDCRQEDPLDAARALQLCAERCEAWVESAEATGRKIAGAACYPYLLPALEALFAELCSRLSARLRLLSAELSTCEDAWRPLPAALATAAAADTLLESAKAADGMLARRIAQAKSDQDAVEAATYLAAPSGKSEDLPLSPLGGAVDDAARVCRSLGHFVLDCVCEPAARQLDKIAELPVWTDNDPLAADLPDFSIAPQEYITQTGQYLMTLPQHLEPLTPRSTGTGPASHVYLLNEVCTRTCELYAEKLHSIRKMDTLGTKRCATDIAYLSSVVEELGGTVPTILRNLERSLRSSKQQE